MNTLDELKVIEALNQLRERKYHHKTSESTNSPAFSNYGTPPPGLAPSGKLPLNPADAPQTLVNNEKNILSEPKKSSALAIANPAIKSTGVIRHGTQEPKVWKNVLITATSLVLTRDARKKLRHMLTVLRLATDHLHVKIDALKSTMDEDATNDNVTPVMSSEALRNDILTTIKKSLTMISTIATNSLPGNVRNRVRRMILKLPSRWAVLLESDDGVHQSESAVLALATETLISIGNITNILSDTLERADLWVERLPRIQLTKRKQKEQGGSSEPDPKPESDENSDISSKEKSLPN